MKKQFVSNNKRSIVTRFGFAVLLFLSLSQSFAQTAVKDEEPFVAVKYIGAVENKAQFQVDVVNDNDEAYLLAIQAQDGTVLYKEKIAKKIFTKKFEWNNEESSSPKLVFTVTGERSKKSQVFEVNTQVRTVQDVVINKLDK